MDKTIIDKIAQISLLANEIRFKIVLALFNSDIIKKLGKHSCSFDELKNIVDTKSPDLSYHLELLMKGDLIEKVEDVRGYYHISDDGKSILEMFDVTPELVKKLGKEIIK